MTPADEPRLIDIQYATGEEPGAIAGSSRKNEAVGWNGWKWANHPYIYYYGQESLRRNGVALIVNSAVQHAVLGCNLKNDRMTSDCFQDKPFNIKVIQACAPTTDCKETSWQVLWKSTTPARTKTKRIESEIRLAAEDRDGLYGQLKKKNRPGADCGSDHEVLIEKFRLKLKKVGKTTRSFRYDLNQILCDYTVEVSNGFKGLDLVDRVPEDYGYKLVTLYGRWWPNPSPRKKKYKKAEWFSEETLQIAEKRREVKDKRERGKYYQLNAELQKITRRDQKICLNEQCKEIEENNRMGKIRDVFKKIGVIKGSNVSYKNGHNKG